MNPEVRYFLACARLAALGDIRTWTPQDLMDVCALVEYPVSFEAWLKRRATLPNSEGTAPAPVNAAPPEDVPDPETTATMEALLSGKGKELIDKGILSIEEVKP